MAYRSDVALVLTKSGVEQFKNALAKVDNEIATDADALLNSADDHRIDEKTGAEMWYWEWIKWNPIYPECRCIEDAFFDLPREEYLFCCLGEEIEDNQEDGYFTDNPFDVEFVRYINIKPKTIKLMEA